MNGKIKKVIYMRMNLRQIFTMLGTAVIISKIADDFAPENEMLRLFCAVSMLPVSYFTSEIIEYGIYKSNFEIIEIVDLTEDEFEQVYVYEKKEEKEEEITADEFFENLEKWWDEKA